MRKWLFASVAVVVLATLGIAFRPVVVFGRSMLPALNSNQVVMMDTRYDETGGLHAGDVVVFRHGGENLIKRICALAGDRVTFVRFSNGATVLAQDDAFAFGRAAHYARRHPDRARLVEITVPEGCVYVLGDNRTASVDSRSFGPVPTESLVGRVVAPGEMMAAVPRHVFGPLPALVARVNRFLS